MMRFAGKLVGLGLVSLFVAACRMTSRVYFPFKLIGNDPDGILREAALNATQRWRSATGLDIRVLDADSTEDAPYTVQWVTPEEMRKAPGQQPGAELPGGLTVNPSPTVKHVLVRDDLGNFDLVEAVLVHEMGHVLRDDAKHAKSGVFDERTFAGELINQDVLDSVCEEADCHFTVPEPDADNQT